MITSSVREAHGGRIAASASSEHHDTRTAADEIAGALHDALGGRPPDLVIVMASFHHVAALPEACGDIRRTLVPGHLLAATAESVLGDARELEGIAGMSALALRIPGARCRPWRSTPWEPVPISDALELARRLHITEDTRCVLALSDPFSTPSTRMLPAIGACRGAHGFVPVAGGLLSGASQPACNRLVLDDVMQDAGAVGVTFSGDIDVSMLVTQGCRPVGQPVVITDCRQNVITQLAGRPALDVVRSQLGELHDAERSLLSGGLLVGRALDPGKKHLGRGDFVVRNVLGVDQDKGSIAVSEMPRRGQTVQLHLRDAQAAHEDLQLLLDGQQVHDPPLATFLVTCNTRGQRLFGGVGHDASVVRERLDEPPLCGFFAAGEYGPLSGRNIVHGHTMVATVIR